MYGHALCFHKVGKDGTAKCDAYYTGGVEKVYGVVFAIDPMEKENLDRVEGLGQGYEEKTVDLQNDFGQILQAKTYYATHLDPRLKPLSWYVGHVLIGAREANLPTHYLSSIESIESLEDEDRRRDAEERAIHST
ncbi:MAG: gamma-glutamylcyclotransferase [Gammaproteobacteria bacterium]|nr:gamma-glutamylcyclotransferase [Gammaproteobacteria bacterium]